MPKLHQIFQHPGNVLETLYKFRGKRKAAALKLSLLAGSTGY